MASGAPWQPEQPRHAAAMRILPLLLLALVAATAADSAHAYTPLSGTVSVMHQGKALATIALPETAVYLEAADARYKLEKEWDNEPDDSVLGLILQHQDGSIVPVVVSWDANGHTEDDDAQSIDFNEVMSDMKKGQDEANKALRRHNRPTQELLGWAAKPYYDSVHHTLHWAKRFRVSGVEGIFLNYNMRILGARGTLELNPIGKDSELPMITSVGGSMLAATALTPGNRYEDFDSSRDAVNSAGIVGLIAGAAVAKKLGFFALIGVLLLKGWKIVLIAGAGLTWLVKKLWWDRRGAKPAAASVGGLRAKDR